ncbi:hypothetical protein IIV22_103R [Invertebrate iridescent virus 22]|uniref:Uncharacterized protein n=1 Tax=Invertebrate iridescent virus 22 TaxID=345198 RepID=S6DF63_9VIRU|nr:hypothetical protein IIV22_103R [Invertebrate iridescent virus 22]CCV01780.1 hypothetical protein IIV22_103R [Invertebrate iridescent virus 22]
MELSNKFKLTPAQREDIVKKYTNGTSVVSISKEYNVSRQTVYTIIEKVKYPHKKNDFFINKLEDNKVYENMTSSTTNFLGITIDTENGSTNPKVRKALDTSFKLLDITQFIEVTKFKLNMVMFDYFWQVVVGNQCLHVSTLILNWFGYEGDYRKQKESFIKILKRNTIEYRELTQKDKEIKMYPTIQEELQLLPHDAAKSRSKFLIMAPHDLKMAIMQLKTKNGHIIRQYYIDLEELLKVYTEYTLYFNHRESQRKITNLEQMMADIKLERQKDREIMLRQEQYMRSLGITLEEVKDQNEVLIDDNKEVKRKLGIAVEDRAPLPADESKRERFVLIKRNDPDYYPYYTIRAQEGYTIRKLKTEKLHFPNLEVLLDFKCNPNSKSLYTRIKENLKSKGVTFKGNNIDLEDSEVDEEKLVEEMKATDSSKRDI